MVMNYLELIDMRHTVREYKNLSIRVEHQKQLNDYLQQINQESGMNFQLVIDAPHVFEDYIKPKGRFENAQNFIALVSKEMPNKNELIGYYGQKVVLYAQHLGLNTCWIASTYTDDPETYTLEANETLALIISIGYGQHPGKPHESKPIETTYEAGDDVPEWFLLGVQAALKAPTARNQQSYKFILRKDGVEARSLGGRRADIDLGIVKLHFELGAQQPVKWLLNE